MGLLPEGYKRLLYIESTGTQYINTGFNANNNTRVLMDAQHNSYTGNGSYFFYFGCTDGANTLALGDASSADNLLRHYYGGTNYGNTWDVPIGNRRVIDCNKQTAIVDGTAKSYSAYTFSFNIPMFLFGYNNRGAFSYSASMKLFSCKIWDNGTLVRDYIPAKNPDGVVGLYDTVSGTFNAGVGTFVAGPEWGYVELEYIESSGTQYIDTGFKQTNNSRIVVDAQLVAPGTVSVLFGSRDASKNKTMDLFWYNGVWNADFYNEPSRKTFAIGATERIHADFNKNVLTLNGISQTYTNYTFQCEYPQYLFAMNEANTGRDKFNFAGKLFSYQAYDNGILVRDYVPAKLIDGTVGLLDKVSGVFYGNAGTGSFIAGPERPGIEPPQAPEGFQIPYTDFANILLMWPVVPGADGYNIARDGELVVSTPQPYLHDTGLNMNTEYTYSITAYNVGGESKPIEATASTTDFKLITDRTADDVESAIAAINSGVLPSNWLAGMKGAYNATDLNRVESAVMFVIERLRVAGWYLQAQSKYWTFADFPSASEMQRYLDNVRLLRSALPAGMPAAPADMNLFRYNEANAIEIILERLDATVANIMKNIYYSSEIYSGEVR